MPELRKDYVTGTWVVIATERGKRPSDFPPEDQDAGNPETCPFCPGHEDRTPKEVLSYRANGTKRDAEGWWVRVVPNRFPALMIEGDVDPRVTQLHTWMNGVGAHEVVIETPDHYSHLALQPLRQVEEMVWAYRDRYIDLTRDKRFRYISIFKNHGRTAGASLSHPHSQIIATPIIPRRIMDELNGAREYYYATGGMCLFDEIIRTEKETGERVIVENDSFIAISPFAPRFAFEVWILPKNHDPVFEDLHPHERSSLAAILKDVLSRYNELMGNPSYNYYIHTAPCDGNDYRFYHWHIEITPRLNKMAGFERGTGFYINPVTPEAAATFLRERRRE